jgi:hypothetical protein
VTRRLRIASAITCGFVAVVVVAVVFVELVFAVIPASELAQARAWVCRGGGAILGLLAFPFIHWLAKEDPA